MISPATVADWIQALFLAGLLGTLGFATHTVLGIEADPVDDSGDMKREARRKAA